MTTFFLFQSLRTVRTLKTRRCDLFHRYIQYIFIPYSGSSCVCEKCETEWRKNEQDDEMADLKNKIFEIPRPTMSTLRD